MSADMTRSIGLFPMCYPNQVIALALSGPSSAITWGWVETISRPTQAAESKQKGRQPGGL